MYVLLKKVIHHCHYPFDHHLVENHNMLVLISLAFVVLVVMFVVLVVVLVVVFVK